MLEKKKIEHKEGWAYIKYTRYATRKNHYYKNLKSLCGLVEIAPEDEKHLVIVEKEGLFKHKICGTCDSLNQVYEDRKKRNLILNMN